MNDEINFETQFYPLKNEDGELEEIPALDRRWVDYKEFPVYSSLNLSEQQVKVDAWCSNVEVLIKLCEWLLRLPYHKFWSYIVYGDSSFHQMLDSYLEACPRYTQPELMNRTFTSSKPKISKLQNVLDKKMFMIWLRMSTRREAGVFQTVEHYGKLIYENYLFDIPRMIDLCALYGEDNDRLVKRMIENLFKCQPKYFSDLKDICLDIHRALDRCIQNVDTTVGQAFKMLNQRNLSGSTYNDRTASDTIHFLVDFVHSLNMFLKIFPQAAEAIHENGLTERLPSLFEKTYPSLCDAVMNRKVAVFTSNCLYPLERLSYFEENLVKLFRSLICYNILDPLTSQNQKSERDYKNKDDCVHDFMACMINVITEKTFAAAYYRSFPFDQDVQLMHERKIELDPLSLEFISDAFKTLIPPSSTVGQNNPVDQESTKGRTCEPQTSSKADNSHIGQIRDIFPDLDTNFIMKCLKDYSNNVEQIVNDLLTGVIKAETPKPSHSSIITKTPPEKDKITDSKPGTSGLCKPDNSELSFARISQDLEHPVRLEHSKKRGNRNILADKTAVQESKAIYERYKYENDDDEDDRENENFGVVAADEGGGDRKNSTPFKIKNPNRRQPVESDGDEGNGIYDDEYDDTYDSHEINVEKSNTIDESESKFRRLNVNGSDDEKDKATANKGPNNAENQPPKPWRGDYTGGKDRQYKERHKGRAAHHNRKAGSLYKHSRGFGFY